MRITRANNKAIEYACKNFHYAKAVPVNTVGYNVYNSKDEWCGVVLYGTGANNNIGNEFDLKQGECVELVRVALNGKQECTSQAVAMSLKAIKKDLPLCRLVISYADCDQSHLGTIYQATNWIFVGTKMENTHDSSWIVNGKRVHGRIISDWVKSRGGCKTLQDSNLYKNTTIKTLDHTLQKENENTLCRLINEYENKLSRCVSRTLKPMRIGIKSTEIFLKNKMSRRKMLIKN